MTFTYGFLRFDKTFDLVGGSWSLFVEETFYIFLPLLFAKIKNLYSALGLLVGTLVLAHSWTIFASNHPRLQLNSFAAFFPLSYWYVFAVGIVAFFLITHPVLSQKLYDRPEKVALLDVLAASSLLLFFTAGTLWPVLSLFFLVIASVSPKSIFGRIMRLPLLMRFGKYCYSIYLLHFFILYAIRDYVPQLFHALHISGAWVELKLLVLFPVVAAACLVIGFISFNLIEKNYVDIGRNVIKWFNRPKHAHKPLVRGPVIAPRAELKAD